MTAAAIASKSMYPLIVSSLLLIRAVTLAQQQPPSVSDFVREYYTVLESPDESCLDSCNRIEGVCNAERISQMALDVEQCQNAVISFVEWTNEGASVGQYSLYPPGSGQNTNATGGCVARRTTGSPASAFQHIQIQTRITSLLPDPTTTRNVTTYTGYGCEESNLSAGKANWSRLCPCLVNVTTPDSDAPSTRPSAAPSLLTALNTIYIRGSSLAQLKQACGVDNFIALFRTTLRAVYDLENDEVGNISVFELNIEGSTSDSPASSRMLGVSFYINIRTNSTLLLTELDKNIKDSLENNVLLEVLESLSNLRNCSLRDTVVIVGLNENIVIYNQEATDVFSTCNSLLRDNHSGDWNRYFSKTSYGPWLILLVIAYFILLLTFVMLVIGPHYSCLVYGTASAAKFKHLWALVFSLILLKILFFVTLVASWQQNDESSFVCSERFFVTGTSISSESLNLLQQAFVPFTLSVAAGLLYVDLGLELSYSSISSGMSCLAFGPFLWLFVIVYVIYAFMSMTSDNAKRNNSEYMGQNEREISENILNVIFGILLLFVSCIWFLDISTDASLLTLKHRSHALCVASAGGVYGIIVIVASVPAVYTSPTLFFFINAIIRRVLEVIFVTGSMAFLLEEMNTPAGNPAFVSAVRQGRGGTRRKGVSRPISYPRGPRGVTFDPLWINSAPTSPPPPYPFAHPPSSISSSPLRSLHHINVTRQSPATKMRQRRDIECLSSKPLPLNNLVMNRRRTSPTAENKLQQQQQSHSTLSSCEDDHFPSSQQNIASPSINFHRFPVSNSPFFSHDMSDIDEEDEGGGYDDRLRRQNSDTLMLQSPPLVPTSSTYPPPRPRTPPHSSHSTIEREYPSSAVSEGSSTESFPLNEPLWMLGNQESKQTSRSRGGDRQIPPRIPMHTNPTNTQHTTHTSNASSILTSSAMSPSEVNVIKDYYDYDDEEDTASSNNNRGGNQQSRPEESSPISTESDSKSLTAENIQTSAEFLSEQQKELEKEDNEYEWSLSHTSVSSPSTEHNSSKSNNGKNISHEGRFSEVWTSVPGEAKSVVIGGDGGNNEKDNFESLEVDTEFPLNNNSNNNMEERVSNHMNSVDTWDNSSSQNHNHSQRNPATSIPHAFTSSTGASVSGSSSSRSSRSGSGLGEVDTGKVDTVAYFNL